MEKRRLSKILAKADAAQVRQMAEKIRKQYEVTVIKAPEKSLTMIKMRDPVKETLFFLGEVIVCEAIVCLDGTKAWRLSWGMILKRYWIWQSLTRHATKASLQTKDCW